MVAILTLGGPTYTITIGKRDYLFEMNRFCGPVRVDRLGNPLEHQSQRFLTAASQWCQQGQQVDRFNRAIYDPNIPLREVNP